MNYIIDENGQYIDRRRQKYGVIFTREVDTSNPELGPLIDLLAPGEELFKQRETLGLTQNEVATLAEIDVRQYQRIDRGERSILSVSFRIGLNICKSMRFDPMYYCYEAGPNEEQSDQEG